MLLRLSLFIKTLTKEFNVYLIGFFCSLLTIWYFCLPDSIFDESYTTVLSDGNNYVLGGRVSEDGQWRFPERFNVPYKFEKAIIQFEDRDFHGHYGISMKAFGRALVDNFSSGKIISGGSTITMQVVRLSRKGRSRSIREKIIEVFQSTRIECLYDKQQILAMYSSFAPMGGNVVGIDAASWRYFNRKAEDLSWAESVLLAVLPNAPSLLHLDRNRDLLLEKRNRLLDRLFEVGELTALELELAKSEVIPTSPSSLPLETPHLLNYGIGIGKKGEWMDSNIDNDLQKDINKILEIHHKINGPNEIHNAAVLVINIKSQQVEAYAGNCLVAGSDNGKDVDIIRAPRSTGSILKPLLYCSLIEDGLIQPSQVIEDIPMIVSGYSPKNYNKKYDGIVPSSEALSRSLNVPFVKLLQDYGVIKFHQKLRQSGLTTINRPAADYGLSLILGGAEASLWDLCSVYGNFGISLNNFNDGNANNFVEFNCFGDSRLSDQYKSFNPAAVWKTLEAMLSVNRPIEDGSWKQFSSDKIGWKTGTSYGFRDAWAIGLNSNYVVGVWVGNADGEGRPGLTGIKTAAPILFDVFSLLPESKWFEKPSSEMTTVKLCKETGFMASMICPNPVEMEVPISCENTDVCPYHKVIHIDNSGNRVNNGCCEVNEITSVPWLVLPPLVEKFYRFKNPTYITLPPYREKCNPGMTENPMAILYPKMQSKIYIPTLLNGLEGKLVFEATHTMDNAEIHWHLDDLYIGKTSSIHQIEVSPKVGLHSLKLIDSYGFESSVEFSVLK